MRDRTDSVRGVEERLSVSMMALSEYSERAWKVREETGE